MQSLFPGFREKNQSPGLGNQEEEMGIPQQSYWTETAVGQKARECRETTATPREQKMWSGSVMPLIIWGSDI